MANIHRGSVRKPSAGKGGDATEAIIHRGSVRVPKSSFDHRAGNEVSGGPAYLGPSKMPSRSTAIKGGTSQKKKHKSTGKGQ